MWTMAILTGTGIAVGLIVRFSPGTRDRTRQQSRRKWARLVKAPSALPGLLAALIVGLAGGVSQGPEHPIMVVNIAPRRYCGGSRLFPALPSGLDDSRCLRHHRRAIRHSGRGGVDIFANAERQQRCSRGTKLFAPLLSGGSGFLTTSLFFSIPIFRYCCLYLSELRFWSTLLAAPS